MRRLMAMLTLVLALGIFGPVAAGPFEDGLAAYDAGDYATMLRLFRPLADQGDAKAQGILGVMYAKGEGVPQDYALAMQWYRKAADQGHVLAQFNLGNMYADGEGVPKDMEYAYSWYSVSAHIGNPKAADAMKAAAGKLSTAEMKSATELSQEMIQKYGKVPKETSTME